MPMREHLSLISGLLITAGQRTIPVFFSIYPTKKISLEAVSAQKFKSCLTSHGLLQWNFFQRKLPHSMCKVCVRYKDQLIGSRNFYSAFIEGS